MIDCLTCLRTLLARNALLSSVSDNFSYNIAVKNLCNFFVFLRLNSHRYDSVLCGCGVKTSVC